MNMEELHQKANEAIERIVKENALAIDKLTEKQIVELLKQVFASGDIIRQTAIGANAQSVVYVPFAEKERLLGRLKAIREICYDLHFSRVVENPATTESVSLPCDCAECTLKRRILEEASLI